MYSPVLDVGHVVLEDGGDVHLGELVLAEDNEETGFTAGSKGRVP